jgi:Tol biopolymer transport system component
VEEINQWPYKKWNGTNCTGDANSYVKSYAGDVVCAVHVGSPGSGTYALQGTAVGIDNMQYTPYLQFNPVDRRYLLIEWSPVGNSNRFVEVMNIDTGVRSQLSYDNNEGHPSWSNDGTKVVYAKNEDLYYRVFCEHVVVECSGPEINITNTPNVYETRPSATNDLGVIYFVDNFNSGRDIARINFDGTGKVVFGVQSSTPRISPSGRYIVVHTSNAAIAAYDTTTFTLNVLTSNAGEDAYAYVGRE